MAENVFAWSITAADNDDADTAVPWPEGMAPGAVNNGARAIMAAMARFRDDITGVLTTTGSANSFALTSRSGYAALANGLFIAAKVNFTNTGPTTLNLNTYGAKSIRIFSPQGEAALIGGEIRNGGTYQFRYDTALDSASGAWLLLNPTIGQEVGTIKPWPSDTAPSGWLFCTGAAVSRTTFAALFAIIGTTYGAGDGSTTFNLPDLRGRAPFGSDDMDAAAASRVTNAGSGIVGTTLGASGGAESVTLTTAQIASHTHTGTTGDQSAVHTHSGTTGTESATHTHNYDRATAPTATAEAPGSGTFVANGLTLTATATTVESQTHTHSITTGTESANHTHSFTSAATGGGALHTNMPPALIVNYIIKA